MQSQSQLQRGSDIILAATVLCAPCAAQLGLGLSPMRTEVRFEGNLPRSGVLMLTNESAEKVRVRAELLDFNLDEDANPQFGRAIEKESEYSCRRMLALNPMEFEVEPGASARVRYTLRPPASEEPRGYHCAAGFTTLPVLSQSTGIGLNMAVRVVAAFYATQGTPAVEAEIAGVHLKSGSVSKDGGLSAVVALRNHANVHFRPAGNLQLLSADGKLMEDLAIPPVPVLPNRTQLVPVRLTKALAPGNYKLRVRLDLGMRAVQQATADVVITEEPASNNIARNQ